MNIFKIIKTKLKIKESLALKLSLYIISAVVVIFISVLVYNYTVSKNLIIESNEENIENLIGATLNDTDNILLPVKKVAEDLGSVLEHVDLTEDQIKLLLYDVVRNNDEIFGCTIAFEPYAFDKKRKYFEPYYYKPNGVLTYLDNDPKTDEKLVFKNQVQPIIIILMFLKVFSSLRIFNSAWT